MSKTKEELDALKEEVNNVNEKLKELTPEELEQINGGANGLSHMGITINTCGTRFGGQCN